MLHVKLSGRFLRVGVAVRSRRIILVAVGDLIRTCAEQRPAGIRGCCAGGVCLRDLDLLEDESHVGEVQVEPLTDGGVRRRHGPRREEAGDNGERSSCCHWTLPAASPRGCARERLSQSIHGDSFREPARGRADYGSAATIRAPTLRIG